MAVYAERHGRCMQITSREEMPKRLSCSGFERHQIAIIVGRKNEITRGCHCAGPHCCRAWHRELPSQLSRCGVKRAQVKLARLRVDDVMSGSAKAAVGNWFLAGAVVELALFQSDYVEQAQLRIQRRRPPVRSTMNRGTSQSPGRRGLVRRAKN